MCLLDTTTALTTFDDQLQIAVATSNFIDHSSDPNRMYATGDLTPNYKGQVQSFKRAVAMVEKRYCVVEDLVTANTGKDLSVVWNMVSRVNASSFSFNPATNTAKLIGKTAEGNSRTAYLKFVVENDDATPAGITMKHENIEVDTSYENAATNHYYIRAKYTIMAGQTQRIKCYILPEDENMSVSNDNFIK